MADIEDENLTELHETRTIWVTVKGDAMRFRVGASVGNSDGIFDAAYDFGEGSGEEAVMSGTPREVGDAVARYLGSLTAEDCREMRYGTARFFIQLVITPEVSADDESGNSRSGQAQKSDR
jgi:hypothetical protein